MGAGTVGWWCFHLSNVCFGSKADLGRKCPLWVESDTSLRQPLRLLRKTFEGGTLLFTGW